MILYEKCKNLNINEIIKLTKSSEKKLSILYLKYVKIDYLKLKA